MENEPNNNYLLYYTKYHPYMGNISKNNIENESLELNEDENDNNNNQINGRWSQKEHLLFIKGCLLYGNIWKKIQNYIQTRSCSQIRSHSQKYFYKLTKKYHNKFGTKLNQEEINKLVNKNKFSNKDMEIAEKHLLALFGNKENKNEKELLEEIEDKENDFNSRKKNRNNNMKVKKEKEKIFNITKVPKDEKARRIQMLESMLESNNAHENEKENDDINYISNEEYEEENNNCEKKIFKKDILAVKGDEEIISQKEEFINKCLDSKDPKDFIKLLTYFGNDINFEVPDINILKKYQDYLGLDLDNSDENIDENSKNKSEEENNMNNNNVNHTNTAFYPYLITPSGNGFQFNPLYNPKIVLHPQIINPS